MSAYGSPEERQAWADYEEATARRLRWLPATHAATVLVGVLVVVAIVALSSPWGWLLSPLPLVPAVVWGLTTVHPEARAAERWREIVRRGVDLW